MNEYPKTLEVLNRFADEWIAAYKTKLADAGYSEGKLYNTINLDSVSVTSDKAVITVNLEEYWKYIENGRRAGAKRPPITVIENWITRRGIIPRPITLKSGKQVIPSTKSLAFVIATSIAKKGIKPRPFFKESFEVTKQKFIKEICEALLKDVLNMKS